MWAAGETNSADLPGARAFGLRPLGGLDAFVFGAKLAHGQEKISLVGAMLLGGADDDFVYGLDLEALPGQRRVIHVLGETHSPGFPQTDGQR